MSRSRSCHVVIPSSFLGRALAASFSPQHSHPVLYSLFQFTGSVLNRNTMAFPVPAHLPRKKDTDVSTTLLTKMSETTPKTLTFELTSSWVSELERAITQTKEQIRERIHSDLPAFEQQFSTSRSIQERLRTLSSNVDTLSTALSHPETGMIPNLVMTLSRHASLAQDVADANARHDALSYLSRCRHGLADLTTLAQEGRLPEVVSSCEDLDPVLLSPPPPLEESTIYTDLQRRYRSIQDRTQEQLSEALSRSISVSSHCIIVRSSVQVRQSDTVLPLSSIISALSSSSRTNHLNTLRRDLTTHYLENIFSQPFSVEVTSGNAESKLTLFPSPPNVENKDTRINNLTTVLTFLNDHLFHHLPPEPSFPRTLAKPVTSALLNKLLIPSLPSSLDQLPHYLSLVRHAVAFEETCLHQILDPTSREREIRSWVDGLASHYERKRRTDILERARGVILREENESEQFRVEVVIVPDTPKEPAPPVIAVGEEDPAAWGFEDESEESTPVDEDGWGFEDEPEPVPEPEPTPVPPVPVVAEQEDPADAWGWNDDEPLPADDPEAEDPSAWDDPWGEEEPAPAPAPVPKTATRLEKLAGKSNGTPVAPPIQSPNPLTAPPPTPAMPVAAKHVPPPLRTEPQIVKESYVVSGRVKELMFLVEDVLREAEELSSSGLLSPSSSTSSVGSVVGQSAAMILDLYRGLYPVTCADQLAKSPKRAVRFSNDCLWVSEEVGKVLKKGRVAPSAVERLAEGQERLKLLADSWFEDSIDNECQNVNDILDGASGFVEMADQEHFDECEAAVNSVLQDIRRWSQQVKSVLTKSKYYNAIGAVVDSALSRILSDVLALPDIPEVESHKLSELCHILGALEALFVEDPEQPSFVVAYVPSWLKFSYLSELLEASMADITYLFEEGALVDFEIEELAKLVCALFADTPLRANTVNKLMQGHPVLS
ncbi:Centromere/kinetochore Zw10-domain-containing protein [Cristinia sonorae]|uniref:Centromere/kinetochore Zw10-domain-containing protein n=1 Tax=Cristinia sonorae TaxID=1940300 RepID=A0A8K0UIG0_9AGAR|nr:Centromere/kinetochore Zw10-domain-containing protein [Cristinia sonorae]